MISAYLENGDREGCKIYCESVFESGSDNDILFSELCYLIPANWWWLSGEFYRVGFCLGWFSEGRHEMDDLDLFDPPLSHFDFRPEIARKKFLSFIDLLFELPPVSTSMIFQSGQCRDHELAAYLELSEKATKNMNLIERNAERLLYLCYDENFRYLSWYQLHACRVIFNMLDCYPNAWQTAFSCMILIISRALCNFNVRRKIATDKARKYDRRLRAA